MPPNGNGIDDQFFVENFVDFKAKVLSLHNTYKHLVLVEEYLGDKEFTVAIIKKGNGEMMVSAIETTPPEPTNGFRILGSTVKKFDTEKLKTIAKNHIDGVKNLAIAAFAGLGVRGFGRIDVKMNNSGQCFFMEANLVPGMKSGSSYYPRACEIDNEIPYGQVVGLMLDECLERVPLQQIFKNPLESEISSCVALI